MACITIVNLHGPKHVSYHILDLILALRDVKIIWILRKCPLLLLWSSHILIQVSLPPMTYVGQELFKWSVSSAS